MEKERKGRSSFVDIRRKSLTLTNIFNKNEEDKEDLEQKTIESPKLSLKAYLDFLVKEKQEWKDILKQKKLLCKNSEGKYKVEPLTILKEDVEEYLTASDREFLENKPNYLEIVTLLRKYMDAVKYLNMYKLDIIDYYEKACNNIEINQKHLINKMSANDLCEICNYKNCQNADHKFIT